MVARIAPSPIASGVASGDALLHAVVPAPRHETVQKNFTESGEFQSTAQHAPPPPAVPGEAFAAAVIAGQLPPRPVTAQQLRQRLGSAWQPPSSPLSLLDKSA